MFGFFNKKKFNDNTGAGGYVGWLGWGRASAPILDKETALEVSAILAATRVIAKSIAKTPLRVVEKKVVKGKQVTRVVPDHWAQRLIESPNQLMTQYELMYWISANAVLGGGALLFKNEFNGRVTELIPVLRWEAEPVDFANINYTIYHANNTVSVVPSSKVIHIKFDTLDGFSGINNLEKARTAAGIVRSLESQQLQNAASGGRPNGIVSSTEPLSIEVAKNLKSDWDKQYNGGESGIAVLDSGMTFTPISQNFTDSQFLENRKFQIDEIARIFGVSPYYLYGSASGVTADEAERALFKDTIIPNFVAIEQTLKKSLLAKEPKMYWDFDDLEILRGDPVKQIPVYAAALGSGGVPQFLTVNEIRESLGFDVYPDEWADKLSPGGYNGVSGLNKEPKE